MKNKKSFYVALVGVALLCLSFAQIFTDPFHQELRGLNFWEWLEKEIHELRFGEVK